MAEGRGVEGGGGGSTERFLSISAAAAVVQMNPRTCGKRLFVRLSVRSVRA